MLTTQLSLIARLSDPHDDESWREFASIYQPAIVRALKLKGLQHVDAEDTAQQILVSIAKTLAKRPHDPDRARFRTWLDRVIRNAAINALKRTEKNRASGGTDAHLALQRVPDASAEEQSLNTELRRQIFHVAAEKIRDQFEPDTWDAFWRTSVLGETIDEVAKDLGKQRGTIYAARSRVMAKFRREVERLEKNLRSGT